MQNKQILSTQPLDLETAPAGPHPHPHPRANAQQVLVFDACHVGVVLRAVLFVEIVLGVGAMYGASTLLDWLARVSLLTGGALPATLVWLIAACSLKTLLQRLDTNGQFVAGVLLGALAGLYACAMLALVGMAEQPP
ncbi:MAG: sensor histidine kinase, partial [Acidovorax sp.]